ncbi:MAG TPA: acyl-CoA dehydrogenase family protein [Thermoanaerobaculia bacterium]|nr:acyl-CoA dehydrogenase family protein [Thermoanaerobaculia bacterium]
MPPPPPSPPSAAASSSSRAATATSAAAAAAPGAAALGPAAVPGSSGPPRAAAEAGPNRPGGGPGFALSEDQELLREQVRRFAEERIRPGVQERDRDHRFPVEIVAEMGELGLLGMLVAEEHGGAGADLLTYLLAVEELARVCPAMAVTMSVSNSVCCWPIGRFGGEALKRRALPELAGGALGAFGLTEPGAGSDAGSLRTAARRDGDSWVLSGEKAWISNAGFARWYVVVARTDPAAGKRGLTAFAVPAEAPGFAVGEPEAKLGLRASQTAPIYFDECRVPADHVLGEPGQGFKIALATLDHSRLGIAAQSVGIHQRALELAIAYARERVQFGVPIVRHQAIRFRIAQMATELQAARLLTWRAALAAAAAAADDIEGGHGAPGAAAGGGAAKHVAGEAGRLAAEAKVFASEAANRACQESLQIHGGNGFHDDYEISRLYRDVRVTTIYEGTSEMQRLVIARQLLQR